MLADLIDEGVGCLLDVLLLIVSSVLETEGHRISETLDGIYYRIRNAWQRLQARLQRLFPNISRHWLGLTRNYSD